jgi:pSer/pThr/pTyr-binding forkhead associated (FHA) protein
MQVRYAVRLRVVRPDGARVDLEFVKPEITIGRVRDSDVVCEGDLVSRRHAKVVVAGTPFLEDVGSLHGVVVNGEIVKARRPLRDGDRIVLPDGTRITFETVWDPRAFSPPAPRGPGAPN